jgi:hypothetical protein
MGLFFFAFPFFSPPPLTVWDYQHACLPVVATTTEPHRQPPQPKAATSSHWLDGCLIAPADLRH